MEELKLPMNQEEEAKAKEQMERLKEAADAELSIKLDVAKDAEKALIPKDVLNDQWKRGGICSMCRRRDYCKTQCRANRDFAAARIREYLRRRCGIPQIEAALGVGDNNGFIR